MTTTGPTGTISEAEVYTLAELKRRLGWKEHATRQARRAGLEITRFGAKKFVTGRAVLAFFAKLAEQQQGNKRVEE